MVQKLRQLAALHEMHPARHAMQGGKAANFTGDGHAAILQRVGFEDEVMVGGGAFGKALDDEGQKFGHGAEGRVHLEACVMFQLQKDEVIGRAAMLDAPGGDHAFKAVQRQEGEPLAIEPELLPHGQGAVRAEIAVVPEAGQHEPVVKRAPEHVLAHVAPMGGRVGQIHVGLGQRRLHLGDAEVHQPRMAVRAAAFISDPVGAQIPLFKDVDSQAEGSGDGGRLGVDRAGVAVKHQIGDAFAGNDLAKRLGPVVGAVLVGDIGCGGGPEGAVAPVEADPPDRRPRRRQHLAQTVENGTVRSLQEQKDVSVTRAVHVHPDPPRLGRGSPGQGKGGNLRISEHCRDSGAILRRIWRAGVADWRGIGWRATISGREALNSAREEWPFAAAFVMGGPERLRRPGMKAEDKKQMKSASRLYAVQALFQMEASGQTVEAVTREFETHRFGAVYDDDEMADGDVDHFRAIVNHAVNLQARIDQMTDRALVAKWPIARIDPVLRALFRAAGAELIEIPTPPRVAISEYVDVAKAFFPDGKEAKFVNAVLDHMAHEARPDGF